MHNPSPFDMIRKANRKAYTSDRWAALLNNTQERIPVARDQETPPVRQAESSYDKSPRENYAYPQLMDPPFAPPQARHPMLDEIAQRHSKALKNAKKPQEWVLRQSADEAGEKTGGDKKESLRSED